MEKRATALIRIFPGSTPCYFYYRDTEKLFGSPEFGVSFTPSVYRELCDLLGEENVGIR
jgi:hypothetical protein